MKMLFNIYPSHFCAMFNVLAGTGIGFSSCLVNHFLQIAHYMPYIAFINGLKCCKVMGFKESSPPHFTG